MIKFNQIFSIGNLKNLKELNLKFNKLTELPESIGNLNNQKVKINSIDMTTFDVVLIITGIVVVGGGLFILLRSERR